jgi:hypothetical protein
MEGIRLRVRHYNKSTVTEVKPVDYSMEMGPMGPIGEGGALMLRVNRNCPWNRCLFCPAYKERRFSPRTGAEIEREIDAVRRVVDLLESASWEIGLGGRIQAETVERAVHSHPEIYGEGPGRIAPEQASAARHTLYNVAGWLANGGARVFLQDANALVMKTGELAGALKYLQRCFPSVTAVTSYARSKTCAQKSAAELQELKDAGLSWVFVGIESGNDEVLKRMRKGAAKKDHMDAGRKIISSGIRMAAFVMPGLGGGAPDLSRSHVRDTLEVLNEIRPTEVRVRSLAVLETSLLAKEVEEGQFSPPTEDGMAEELRMLLEGISFDCTFETLQMTNLFAFKGLLGERRDQWLGQIEHFQRKSPLERAQFLFCRYVNGGYLHCVKSWGKDSAALAALVAAAEKSLEGHSPDAPAKVERAVFAIKSKGIP